jgi:integrase/recombinase XerD
MNIGSIKVRQRKWTSNSAPVFYAVFKEDGKERWVALDPQKVTTKREALQEVAKMEAQVLRGLHPLASRTTIRKWLDDYLRWCVGRKQANTIRVEKEILDTWFKWLTEFYPRVQTPTDLRFVHFEEYQGWRRNSPRLVPARKEESASLKKEDTRTVSARRVNLELTVLRFLCKTYSMHGSRKILVADPTEGIRKLREAKPATRAVPKEDLPLVEKALADVRGGYAIYHVLAFRLMHKTGMRPGECFALRWIDLDSENGYLVIDNHELHTTKTRHTRTVAIGPAERSLLQELYLKREGDTIFPLGFNAFKLALKRACQRAGVRTFGPYALRHTAATRMLEAGAPIHGVMGALGHRQLSTTQKYAHETQRVIDKAVSKLWES